MRFNYDFRLKLKCQRLTTTCVAYVMEVRDKRCRWNQTVSPTRRVYLNSNFVHNLICPTDPIPGLATSEKGSGFLHPARNKHRVCVTAKTFLTLMSRLVRWKEKVRREMAEKGGKGCHATSERCHCRGGCGGEEGFSELVATIDRERARKK